MLRFYQHHLFFRTAVYFTNVNKVYPHAILGHIFAVQARHVSQAFERLCCSCQCVLFASSSFPIRTGRAFAQSAQCQIGLSCDASLVRVPSLFLDQPSHRIGVKADFLTFTKRSTSLTKRLTRSVREDCHFLQCVPVALSEGCIVPFPNVDPEFDAASDRLVSEIRCWPADVCCGFRRKWMTS